MTCGAEKYQRFPPGFDAACAPDNFGNAITLPRPLRRKTLVQDLGDVSLAR
jgi:hypothetical protein